MKFSICLAFVIVGLVFGQSVREITVPESQSNSTRCIYFPDTKLISCQGVSGEVECDAFSELDSMRPRECNFFGIRQLVDVNMDEIDSVMFEIFPREAGNLTYVNNLIQVNGEETRLVMYTAETGIRSGIRISSVSCWRRLVEVLRGETQVQNFEIDGIEGEVSLIGEVAVSDRSLQKKWLYGLGWGGFGYGYPFFWGK